MQDKGKKIKKKRKSVQTAGMLHVLIHAPLIIFDIY